MIANKKLKHLLPAVDLTEKPVSMKKVLYFKSSHETSICARSILIHLLWLLYDHWTRGPKFYAIKEPMTQEQKLLSATEKKRKTKLYEIRKIIFWKGKATISSKIWIEKGQEVKYLDLGTWRKVRRKIR